MAQGFQQDRQDDSPQHRFPKMYMKFLSSVQPSKIEPDIYLEYSFWLKFFFVLSLQSKIQIALCRPLWNLLSWIFVIVSLIPTRQIINVVIICRRLHVIRLKFRLGKGIILYKLYSITGEPVGVYLVRAMGCEFIAR